MVFMRIRDIEGMILIIMELKSPRRTGNKYNENEHRKNTTDGVQEKAIWEKGCGTSGKNKIKKVEFNKERRNRHLA